MNENLNLVDILKDCPCGTKLYSTIRGDVEFEKIVENTNYPIQYKYRNKNNTILSDYISIDGKYSYYGECILFPSKDQRDWFKFKVEPELVDGEIYYCNLFNKHNAIYIHRKTTRCKTEYYVKLDLCDLGLLRNGIITTNEENIKELRKVTEEEKQQLLNAIKREGYKWDEEKKELVKIEPKFDISTLQHFNRVLVRGTNGEPWSIDFFSHIIKNDDIKSPIFCCMCSVPQQCIPYNEETKHLVDKIKMPHKKYITWEE